MYEHEPNHKDPCVQYACTAGKGDPTESMLLATVPPGSYTLPALLPQAGHDAYDTAQPTYTHAHMHTAQVGPPK